MKALANLARRPRRLVFALLAACTFPGCGYDPEAGEEAAPDYEKVVPVTGTVTINGEPVPGVVVTFLPPKWSAGYGETDARGRYTLRTAGRPGALPGDYKVSLSYLVSPDGQPQGLGPRSAITPSPAMAGAVEKLPAEYSDFGRTRLKASVPPAGGPFDFDVEADLNGPEPPPAAPHPKAEEKAAAPGDRS